jgi:hypothetical protein
MSDQSKPFGVRHPLTGEFLVGFACPENSTVQAPVWTANPANAASYDEAGFQWAAKEVHEHVKRADPLAFMLISIMGLAMAAESGDK